MSTEVWFRNPHNYIRELVECGYGAVVWDRGTLVNKRIDPLKHANLYFGQGIPYRLLLVGEQGSAEYRPESEDIDHPYAVYPTWSYGDDAALLEEVVAHPIGSDVDACNDKSLRPDERPVLGQQHRVVIINSPSANTGPGRHFMRYLKELQEEYPNCIIHVHGLYGWKVAFGMGFGAADVDPRTPAQKGKVTVPAGREMQFEAVQKHPQWVTVLGFKPVDLQVPRNRCIYNIRSAIWAGEHYAELERFKSKSNGHEVIDTQTPDAELQIAETKQWRVRNSKKAEESDKILCNSCSLQLDCKYFREGAVCSVPGAEPAPLARFFKTRDSGIIIDGLTTLMAIQTRRLERGMLAEEEFDELDPEVTKLLNSLFDQGTKLAKLLDPSLRGGPKVGVFIGDTPPKSNDPRQFVSQVVRSLEQQGIPREKITPELVQSTLAGMMDPSNTQRAIEGQVISREDELA